MITGIDHIAIAVSNIDSAISRFTEDLGLRLTGQESVIQAQTQTAFLNQVNTRLELVHPLNQQGPIANFLEKRGDKGGLHHICFSSDNLDEDIKILKQKGYVFINDVPSQGAHGSKVVWLHPSCCDGLLIELAQAPTTK